MSKQYDAQVASNLGEINITTSVLETIAAEAALEVKGVNKMHTSLPDEFSGFFGADVNRFGAKLNPHADGRLAIDVQIHLEYGYSVPEVAYKVQERIKEQILYMTDLVIQEVNVHVISIDTEDEHDAHAEAH